MSSAVAPDGNKTSISLFVGFARELNGMSRPCRGNYVDLQPFFAQPRECRPGELGRAAATSGWVDDCKELMPQSCFIPSKEMLVSVRARPSSQRQKHSGAVELRKLLRERVSLNFERSGARI